MRITEQHISCEDCGSSDAKCVYEDGHSYCFSCQTFHPPGKDISNLNYTYEFYPHRGLIKDTLQQFDIKTKINEEGKPIADGFRYPNGLHKARYLETKDFYWEKKEGLEAAKAGLFGRDKFSAGSHKFVTITEGEYDAASYWQVLRSPVVSVQSSTSAVRDCTVDRDYLNSFERIVLAFDGDSAGRDAASKVARLFDYNKLLVVSFDKYKDASDYLQHGDELELRNIWWNARRYLPDTVVSSFYEFAKILKEKPKVGIPYPFPMLTEMTYGIRTGESVLITAPEGVGKTEVMHAIEYQLLEKTDDNLGAIFLEEPKHRHLQALGGILLQKPTHLPNSGVTEDQVLGAVQQLVKTDDRLHLYSHFGSADPEVLLDTIRFLASARLCRYILLDHISMVVSGLGGEDERKALDYISTRLEMMVKELDFALLLVSHVNDFGQTRGSRYISKVADIRIDLTRDVLNGSNVVDMRVAKNRFSGGTGPAGSYTFDQYTRQYSPVDSAANDNATPQEKAA